MTTIQYCEDRDRERWDAFVTQSPRASLYHLYDWRTVNATSFGHRSAYLAAVESQDIVGIFPLVQVKSQLFGNIACSLPFVNYGGPCGRDEAVEQLLLQTAGQVAEGWKVSYIEIRGRTPLPGLPTSEHKVSLTVELNADPDVLWKAYTTAHRQDIRKGYKRGLTARSGGIELIADFYAVLSESWRDLGTPIYSRAYLETVARTFDQLTRITVVYAGDEPAAAAFYMVGGGIAEGLWLGSRGKFRNHHAGYVLYWELLKDACQLGAARFHLGRSSVQSGGETFKRKWNAETTQLYWQYVLRNRREIPQVNVTNPKYRLAIKAWQKLPVPVTQMIGPFIARSIP